MMIINIVIIVRPLLLLMTITNIDTTFNVSINIDDNNEHNIVILSIILIVIIERLMLLYITTITTIMNYYYRGRRRRTRWRCYTSACYDILYYHVY